MKRILWLSRHSWTEEHKKLLEDIFGEEVKLFLNTQYAGEASEIRKIYEEGKFDDLVITTSMDIIGQLCKSGIPPIRALHKVTGYTETGGRIYKFLRFERISSVTIKKKILTKKRWKYS